MTDIEVAPARGSVLLSAGRDEVLVPTWVGDAIEALQAEGEQAAVALEEVESENNLLRTKLNVAEGERDDLRVDRDAVASAHAEAVRLLGVRAQALAQLCAALDRVIGLAGYTVQVLGQMGHVGPPQTQAILTEAREALAKGASS